MDGRRHPWKEANGGARNPDLFFNRARVLHYREDYAEAARSYRTAQRLDPSLPVGQALHDIETGVDRLAELLEKKGGLKAKRLSQLVAPLETAMVSGQNQQPYRMACLKGLRVGPNKGVAIALKLVMPVSQCDSSPERLIVIDAQAACLVLSLYSISKEACDKIQPKDILIVRNPTLRRFSLCSPYSEPPSEAKPRGDASEAACDVGTRGFDGGGGGSRTGRAHRSYMGIESYPAEILINGRSMRACFAPPSVQLSNFDK